LYTTDEVVTCSFWNNLQNEWVEINNLFYEMKHFKDESINNEKLTQL